jgi:hypothetical protein
MKTLIRKFSRPVSLQGAGGLALAMTLALGQVACGNAQSNEDTESEAAAAAEAPAATPRAAAPRPAPAAPAAPRPAAKVIPAGSVLTFEVTENVSTSSHDAGDGFSLRLVDGVSGSGGAMLPSGATARGVVTQSVKSSSSNEDALLAVEVRSVQVSGSSQPFTARVVSASVETSRQNSTQRSAAKIATGAAAGAIIGQILGKDTRGTVTGAAVGAAVGTAVALTTRGGHAELPVGSRVTVELTQAMTLP